MNGASPRSLTVPAISTIEPLWRLLTVTHVRYRPAGLCGNCLATDLVENRMSLVSKWFRHDARLRRCLVSDPDHVTQNCCGPYVSLIQGALTLLDNSPISEDELSRQMYGPSTAAAVLAFKRKRKIINKAYQTQADNVVGKMTIRALDAEMAERERARFHLMFAVGIKATPRAVILSEVSASLFVDWADNLVRVHKGEFIKINGEQKPELQVSRIQQAVFAAGAGGLLIFSVGHGACFPQYDEHGVLDLAQGGRMRIVGKNYKEDDPKDFISPYYDDKPAQSSGGGLKPLSQKDKDERDQTPHAKRRLKNWALWQQVCQTIRHSHLGGVLLLTCKIGGAPKFLERIATEWQTPIIAYKDQAMCYETPARKARAILAKDKNKNEARNLPHTNTPWGEIFYPLSLQDMVLIQPKRNP
jgi:hypothetical protein